MPGRMVYIRANKTKPSPTGHSNGWWPEKKKLEVLTCYLATGSLRIASSMYNVPLPTVESWRTTQWWKDRITELQEQDNIKLDAKLSKIVEKTLAGIEDRLDNGDYVIDSRTGKPKRIPVKLRDIHRVAADMIDRQKLLRQQTETKKEANETINGRLLKLAEHFAEIATGKTIDQKIVNEVYDIEDVEPMENKEEAQEGPHEALQEEISEKEYLDTSDNIIMQPRAS